MEQLELLSSRRRTAEDGSVDMKWRRFRQKGPPFAKTAKGRPGPSEWIVDKRLVSGKADAIMYGYIRESA